MSTFFWRGVTGNPTTASNWQKDDGTTAALPGAGDDVVVKKIPGLTQLDIDAQDNSAVAWNSLTIDATWDGLIGTTSSASASFYGYWKIDSTLVTINGSQSGRIKLQNTRTTAVTTVLGTGTSTDTDYDPVRLALAHANTKVYVLSGTVGIGNNHPGETSTVGDIDASGPDAVVNMGVGVTWTNAYAADGASINPQSGGTLLTSTAGTTCTISGVAKVTTVNTGGVVNLNNRPATDALTVFPGGFADFSGNPATATVAARTLHPGSKCATFAANPGHITFTATTLAGGAGTVSVS